MLAGAFFFASKQTKEAGGDVRRQDQNIRSEMKV